MIIERVKLEIEEFNLKPIEYREEWFKSNQLFDVLVETRIERVSEYFTIKLR
jgi:hypothetical protein